MPKLSTFFAKNIGVFREISEKWLCALCAHFYPPSGGVISAYFPIQNPSGKSGTFWGKKCRKLSTFSWFLTNFGTFFHKSYTLAPWSTRKHRRFTGGVRRGSGGSDPPSRGVRPPLRGGRYGSDPPKGGSESGVWIYRSLRDLSFWLRGHPNNDADLLKEVNNVRILKELV